MLIFTYTMTNMLIYVNLTAVSVYPLHTNSAYIDPGYNTTLCFLV